MFFLLVYDNSSFISAFGNRLRRAQSLISIHPFRRIILRRHRETLSLTRTPVHNLDDIDELLLVADLEIEFVVVASAEVDLDMFIPWNTLASQPHMTFLPP